MCFEIEGEFTAPFDIDGVKKVGYTRKSLGYAALAAAACVAVEDVYDAVYNTPWHAAHATTWAAGGNVYFDKAEHAAAKARQAEIFRSLVRGEQ